jgi:hypothetical protein
VGPGIIRVAKAPDPDGYKLDETKRRRGDHRREIAGHMVAMLLMLPEAQDGKLGIPDRDLRFVADVRLGERIGPAGLSVKTMASVGRHPGNELAKRERRADK